MALLETGMAPGQQILKPTDPAKLFRQQRSASTAPATVRTQAPVATPTVAPVTPAPAVQPTTTRAAAPSIATPKLSTPPAHTVSTAPGVAYKYESPQGQKGVLDKNYYEDLGFSTSKGEAKKIREDLSSFGEEVSTKQTEIEGYEEELSVAQDKLKEEISRAVAASRDTLVSANPFIGRPGYESATWRTAEEVAKAVASNPNLWSENAELPSGDPNWYREQQLIWKYWADRGVYNVVPNGYKDMSPSELARLHNSGVKKLVIVVSKAGGTLTQTAPLVADALSPIMADYEQRLAAKIAEAEAASTSVINQGLLDAKEARAAVEIKLNEVDELVGSEKQRQAANREGMAETFNSLFRQRSK